MNIMQNLQTNTCNYRQEFPSDKLVHCMAYSYAERKDGRHWGHYPLCQDGNCPIRNEKLLEGAILKNCYTCGQIGFTCGDCIKHSEWIAKEKGE